MSILNNISVMTHANRLSVIDGLTLIPKNSFCELADLSLCVQEYSLKLKLQNCVIYLQLQPWHTSNNILKRQGTRVSISKKNHLMKMISSPDQSPEGCKVQLSLKVILPVPQTPWSCCNPSQPLRSSLSSWIQLCLPLLHVNDFLAVLVYSSQPNEAR